MSAVHEVAQQTHEHVPSPLAFSYPIDAFLHQTIQNLGKQLEINPDALGCQNVSFCRGAVNYILKEIKQGPEFFEVTAELESLAGELGNTPAALRFFYSLELYIYYQHEVVRHTENRICEFLQVLTFAELSLLGPLLSEFLTDVPTQEADKRYSFLRDFFANDSADFTATLDGLQMKKNEYIFLLNTPLFTAFLKPLTRLQPAFAYELAQIVNGCQDVHLREETEKALMPVETHWRIKLTPSHDDWYLCERSEEKLVDTLSEQGCLALLDAAQRPLIVVKFKGKPSGLVLQTCKTADGTVLPAGTWISPVSAQTRERLYKAFDTNYQKVSTPVFHGTWAYMRSVVPDRLEQNGALLTLTNIATQLQRRSAYIGQHPRFSPDRQAYRLRYKEEMGA